MIDAANQHIKQTTDIVNHEFKGIYHFSAPCGWINDPNGLSFMNGQIHLFYQHYPYDSKWGLMHWGHATSTDFVNWMHCPIAMAPDEPFDKDGCFSGTAAIIDNKMYIMYTGVHIHEGVYKQEQCLALSADGYSIEKFTSNPVISSLQLPRGTNSKDFRDPKLWEENGFLYSAVAANDKNGGRLLLFRAQKDIPDKWEFISDMIEHNGDMGIMWECPDVFKIEGHDIIILSMIGLPKKDEKFWNNESSVYLCGMLQKNTYKLIFTQFDELDCGFDFYAPQTTLIPDGRRIMLAWMRERGDSWHTDVFRHNWAGAMTIARELFIKNNQLYQRPIAELKNYRKNGVCALELILENESIDIEQAKGMTKELIFDIQTTECNSFCLSLMKTDDEKVTITYNKEKSTLVFDRSMCGYYEEQFAQRLDIREIRLEGDNETVKLQIFIDKSSIEIFINNGYKTLTAVVYPKSKRYGVLLSTQGVLKAICDFYDIEVIDTPQA